MKILKPEAKALSSPLHEIKEIPTLEGDQNPANEQLSKVEIKSLSSIVEQVEDSKSSMK